MTAAMLRMPVGAAGDSSDVAVALEVAGALWDKGDRDEAIRWLKRAVEAASGAGDAARASSLAQAAGELEASLADGHKEPAAPSIPATVPPIPSDAPVVMGGASRPPPMPPMPAHAPSPGGGAAPAAGWGRDTRMRVSVRTSVRDPQLLVLRPLADGQTPPMGTREGFLVLADVDDPRAASNGGSTR